jgi:hypothetical protein
VLFMALVQLHSAKYSRTIPARNYLHPIFPMD